MEEKYQYTLQDEDRLRRAGYRVVTIWECEWTKRKNEDASVQAFVDQQCHFVSPLNPREAFYGGRTNVVKLHHRAEEDEAIH